MGRTLLKLIYWTAGFVGLTVVLGPIMVAIGLGIFLPNVENSFEVEVIAGEAASAELRVCGENSQMQAVEKGLVATRIISCDGGGEIVLQMLDGRELKCFLYLTQGFEGAHRYKVSGNVCPPILNPASANRPPA